MVGIGGDHNGFELKQRLCALLRAQGHGVLDFGAREGETADYPDIAASVAQAVATGNVDRGILVCGSGLGMAIAANKVPGIRAATVHDTYTARLAGERAAAQVIALGAWIVGPELACEMVLTWLAAEFQGGGSARKLAKIAGLEQRHRRVDLPLMLEVS